MPRKLKANAVSAALCQWLQARTRFGDNVTWDCDYPLTKKRHDIVDVVGILKGKETPSILVEVELHREDPVSNVAKIFQWAHETDQHDLVFFQAFSKLYRTGKAERKRRAEFLGKIFTKERRGRYIPLNLKYSPRRGGRYGGGRHTIAAKLLARRLMEYIVRGKLIDHR